MLNGWKRRVRTTSAISSASMMTLTVSHQPSSFLTGVAAASAGFRLFSLICVNSPFLSQSSRLAGLSGEAPYIHRALPRQALHPGAARAHGARPWRNDGRQSGQQDERSRRLARLERAMRLRGFPERQAPADVDRDVAVPDRPEKIARHLLAPGPVGQEGEEGRAGGEERALAR